MSTTRDPHAGKIVLNRMTRRRDRRPRAIEPGYAQLDERTLPELLDFAVRVSPLVHYYGPSNQRDGDWGAFFLSDPIMVVGSIAAMPLARLDEAFADLARRAREARSEARRLALLGEIVAHTFALARLTDGWLRNIGSPKPGSAAIPVLRAIQSAVEGRLAGEMDRLRAVIEGLLALGAPEVLTEEKLSRLWHARRGRGGQSHHRGDTLAERIEHALPALGSIFAAFVQEIAGIQAICRERMPALLTEGDHKPHVALYVAFAEIYRRAMAASADLGRRYVDFYHGEVLREVPRGPVPDSAYLTFTLAPSKEITSALVPAGTRFSAGADSTGADIVFATRESLRVGAARLGLIRALSTNRGALLPGGDDEEVVLQVLATEMTPGGAPFAPFGGTIEGRTPSSITTPASLGMAIATPYLLLSAGERTVRVAMRFTPASMALLRSRADRIAKAAKAHRADILRGVLEEAFIIHLSTKDGWAAVGEYEVLLDDEGEENREIALQIVLPASFPAIAPFVPEEGESLASVFPALELRVDQRRIEIDLGNPSEPGAVPISLFALSLLAELEAESIWLETEVTGLPVVDLGSSAGPLSADKPFFLFGGAPGLNAYLDIQAPELFAKRPESIRVTIDWFDLPPGNAGMSGHYRDYVIDLDGVARPGFLDNRAFRVSFDVIGPAAFDLGDGATNLYLFRTERQSAPDVPDPDGKLEPATAFEPFTIVPAPRPDRVSPDSALRMSLVAPREAFGDPVYAANVAYAVTRTEPDPARCEQVCAAELAALREAAELLATTIGLCGKKSGPACKRCFQSSLSTWRAAALGAIMSCLGKATSLAAAAAKPEAMSGLDEAAARAKGALPDARKEAVERWMLAYHAAIPGTSEVGSAAWMADRLWDAVVCVADCEAASKDGDDKARMVSCLDGCAKKLQAAYDEGRKACLEACRTRKDKPVPNVPWLPRAERVTLDYTATCVVSGAGPTWAPDAERAASVFRLLPFGGVRACPETEGVIRLLPPIDEGASLLLGFTGLAPGEALTMLAHLAATGDAGSTSLDEIVWEALSSNAWIPLQPARPRTDGTRGLQRSGALTLGIPDATLSGNTALSGDHQWIRARVARGADRFPLVVGLHPYTVLATWQREGDSGEHLHAPLPPGSIQKPLGTLAGIESVAQPMESFGGRPAETPDTMTVRLGERLRHKERAIVGWDYERLVLDRFPRIDRVRVLPARNPARGNMPGDVTIVVLPGGSGDGLDATAPVIRGDALEEIAESLLASTSPFVALHVRNPVYVRITVTASVVLVAGVDPTEGKLRLSDALVRALSPGPEDPPWIERGQDAPTEDDIAELLRSQPQVDAVLDARLDYDPKPAGLAWYYLTSAASHQILDAAREEGPSAGEGGLGIHA